MEFLDIRRKILKIQCAFHILERNGGRLEAVAQNFFAAT